MTFPLVPILATAAAGGLVYEVMKPSDAAADDKTPELQSMKGTTPSGAPVQVVVPTKAHHRPHPRRASAPIAGPAAITVVPSAGVGVRYVPPVEVKAAQVPGKLDFLPTVISPSGAASLTVMTTADVQNALNTLGYGPLDVDGKVGTKTQGAVKAWQAKNGVFPVDGVPGPKVRSSLEHALATLAAPHADVGQQAIAAAPPPMMAAPPPVYANKAQASLAKAGGITTAVLADTGNVKAAKTAATVTNIATDVASFFGFDPYRHLDRESPRFRGPRGMGMGMGPGGAGMGPGGAGLGGPGALGTPNRLRSPNRMMPNEVLQPQLDGQDKTVGRGRVKLVFQIDGNLVLYGPGKQVLWASGTNQRGISRLVMGPDGNLTILGNDSQPKWSSNTGGHPGAFLEVTGSDAQIRDPRGGVIWSAAQTGSGATPPPLGMIAPNPGVNTMRAGFGAVEEFSVHPVGDVRGAQRVMNYLGASPPLVIDGEYGRKTVAALKAFQILHGMAATGVLDETTRLALAFAAQKGSGSDFGLTLFTLFGCDEDRYSAFGGRRPAPPTGQIVGGRFRPAGGGGSRSAAARHRHHEMMKRRAEEQAAEQAAQQAAQGGGGGGDSGGGGGGGGDDGGGGGGDDGGDSSGGGVEDTGASMSEGATSDAGFG
jgi:peptidoglycan hydrolase-like protein with peptidoglycan-binding domain